MITSERAEAGAHDRLWWTTVEAGIHVHWTRVPYANAMSVRERMAAFLQFSWRAARRAATIQADVVFATSTPLTIALPAVFAARRRHIPMVFEVRDLWPEIPIAIGALRDPLSRMAARWLERFAYRNAERVVALSPGMGEGVAQTGYPRSRIRIIPNGCDLDLFTAGQTSAQAFRAQYHWLAERPLVMYAGTLGRINGVGYLVDVAAVTQRLDPEIRFVVLGAGREAGAVEARARERGVLGRNFFMLPRVPKEQMPACLAAADVATSLVVDVKAIWANSANKFFDALASGTPILINYGGWQAALLEEHGAGIVVSPGDPAAAATALAALLRDRVKLREMGAAARSLAREKFDRDRLARDLESVLREVVSHE